MANEPVATKNTFKRKFPLIVVEAYPWRKHGDHPKDKPVKLHDGTLTGEGLVVGFYKPKHNAYKSCPHACGKDMKDHGSVATGLVCPGDWIVTVGEDKYEHEKPTAFSDKYEAVTVEK